MAGRAADTTYSLPVLTWAPDGNWLAFVEKASADAPARIVKISLATLERRPLTSPPPGTIGDLQPEISPDGHLFAFVRSSSGSWGNQDVWVQPVAGAEPRRLTSGRYGLVSTLRWTPDGNALLFNVNAGNAMRISARPARRRGAGTRAGARRQRGRRIHFWESPDVRPGHTAVLRPMAFAAPGRFTFGCDARKVPGWQLQRGVRAGRPQDSLRVATRRADGHLGQRCRRQRSGAAHGVQSGFGYTSLVTGRPPARVRFARGRELGSLCDSIPREAFRAGPRGSRRTKARVRGREMVASSTFRRIAEVVRRSGRFRRRADRPFKSPATAAGTRRSLRMVATCTTRKATHRASGGCRCLAEAELRL